jgi:hypothetical protein
VGCDVVELGGCELGERGNIIEQGKQATHVVLPPERQDRQLIR